MGSWTADTQSSKIEHKMSVRAVLRALLRAGLSGVGGWVGEGSDARGSGFDVGGGPSQALAVMSAPDLMAVGPDGEFGGDGDDGELGGSGGVNAGDALTRKGACQVSGRAGRAGAGRRGVGTGPAGASVSRFGSQGNLGLAGHQLHSGGVAGFPTGSSQETAVQDTNPRYLGPCVALYKAPLVSASRNHWDTGVQQLKLRAWPGRPAPASDPHCHDRKGACSAPTGRQRPLWCLGGRNERSPASNSGHRASTT